MKTTKGLKLIAIATVVSFSISAEVRRYEGSGPVEIQVHADVKSQQDSSLKKSFREHFYPAISHQEGFLHCNLLHSTTKERSYTITIAFESETLRMKWANSPLHQKVWPMIQENLETQSISVKVFSLLLSK